MVFDVDLLFSVFFIECAPERWDSNGENRFQFGVQMAKI
jgi:hypothetical protein